MDCGLSIIVFFKTSLMDFNTNNTLLKSLTPSLLKGLVNQKFLSLLVDIPFLFPFVFPMFLLVKHTFQIKSYSSNVTSYKWLIVCVLKKGQGFVNPIFSGRRSWCSKLHADIVGDALQLSIG